MDWKFGESDEALASTLGVDRLTPAIVAAIFIALFVNVCYAY